MSVVDNVLVGLLGQVSLPRVLLRRFPFEARQKALKVLESVGVLEHAYRRADELSGGQQQRVAIARVLAQECSLVLADEPVATLDPQAAVAILQIMKQVSQTRGLTVLCRLHQTDYAPQFADRILAQFACSSPPALRLPTCFVARLCA